MLKRRQHNIENNTGNERWLISYADFVTLLFAFFVVMYSVSHVNEEKYQQLSSTLDALFSSKEAVEGEVVIIDDLSLLKEKLDNSLFSEIAEGNITIENNEFWLEISLNNRILFDSGSVVLSDKARSVLEQISIALVNTEYPIQVEGFTDNISINTLLYPSNWELSSARAVAVVKLLMDKGIMPSRLAAVGYGEYQPIAENTSEEGRALNRRISLMVGKHSRLRPIKELNSASQAQPLTPRDTVTQETNSSNLTPVILDNGEYLFSSDPDLPRNNSRQ